MPQVAHQPRATTTQLWLPHPSPCRRDLRQQKPKPSSDVEAAQAWEEEEEEEEEELGTRVGGVRQWLRRMHIRRGSLAWIGGACPLGAKLEG